MGEVSFAHVSAHGYTAFQAELSSGIWDSIDITTYVGPDGRAAKPLGEAPTFVMVKLQLTWAIDAVVRAWASGMNAKDCDARWDEAQKRLNAHVNAAMYSSDPEHKAAALRLQKTLLLGSGEGQTKLKYHQEVDFGRKQLHITSEGQGAADVALLGLAPMMMAISSTTEALATTIGHGLTGRVPSRRKRAALAACSTTFGAVSHALGWMSEFGAAGLDRERAMALRAPLIELAARYPAPTIITHPKKDLAAPVT